MIQHAHPTAWQSHAPWPKRSQIEQDLRLSRGVAAIFADPQQEYTRRLFDAAFHVTERMGKPA